MSFNTFYINADILRNNLKIIKKIANDAKVCFPVKANAYGHGIKEIVSCSADLVDMYAVANYDEALAVYKVNKNKSILIFGAIDFANIQSICSNKNLQISIQNAADIALLETIAIKHKITNINAHIKINTGMNRIGVAYCDAKEAIELAHKSQYINLIGIYSHLACADDKNNDSNITQMKRFDELVTYTKQLDSSILCHLSNSYGLLGQTNISYDMVRPGILSYGFLPSFAVVDAAKAIKPVGELRSKVAKLNILSKEFLGVGYSEKYTGCKDEVIATLPIGYGDGYFRMLGDKAQVQIRDKYYPVVGRISMDALAVSLGDNSDNISVDDEVIVISANPDAANSVKNLAKLINTIEYDIVTTISNRVDREVI